MRSKFCRDGHVNGCKFSFRSLLVRSSYLLLPTALNRFHCKHSANALVIENKVRFRARIAYDGSKFQGFQLQKRKNCRTVQGVLEDVINQRLGFNDSERENSRIVRVVGAGRTDTGVHARGQAIHFDVPSATAAHLGSDQLPLLCDSLNKMLPLDVQLWNLQQAPASNLEKSSPRYRWNVLFDSTRKLYSYRLSLARAMDPIERNSRWHPDVAHNIDTVRLTRILKMYEGVHDFRAFACAMEQNERKVGKSLSTVRIVYSVELVPEDIPGHYRIDFMLKGALYKQVRNMVGAALDVCRDKVALGDFSALLQQQNASGLLSSKTRVHNRSKPAPPEGLTLEMVYFDNDNSSF